jgi:hypothetical protein
MTDPGAAWRGERHLRVTVELSETAARVLGVSLLDGPAVQRRTLSGAVAVRVDVNGAVALTDAFDDPRITRASSRPESQEHRFLSNPTGVAVVDVPLGREPLETVELRFADLSAVTSRSTEPAAIAKYFDARTRGSRRRGTVTLEHLASHPDWAKIASSVGVAARTLERFEIYRDRQKRYRWRLRRPDGEVVADSGQGYADREACERDLRWIRTTGYRAEVRSLDVEPPE